MFPSWSIRCCAWARGGPNYQWKSEFRFLLHIHMVALGHCTADRGDIRRNRNRKIGDKIRLRQDKQQRLKYSGAVSYLPSTTHCLVCRAGVLGCWGACSAVQCSAVQWSEWKVRSGHRTLWTLAMAGSDRPSAGAGHRVSLFTLELETKAM